MNRAKLLVIGGVIVIVAGGALGYHAWASRVPKATASQKELTQFIASEKFKDLPKVEQAQLARGMMQQPIVVKNGELDEQQLAAMKNAAALHRQQMLDAYFKLPPGKARKDYLDKQIDLQQQVEQKMKEAEKQPPLSQPGKDGDPIKVVMKGPGGAAGQKNMMESIPADQQAQMAQFMKDMKDRRAERGLPDQPGMRMIIINNEMRK